MVKPDKRGQQIEPDPKWRPLVDAIFFHNYANELASGQAYFKFDYPWSNAPAAVELDIGSRAFKLSFNDGRVIELPPWELLKSENLPANGLVAAAAHDAVRTSWQFMLERFASAVSDGQYRLFARLDDFRASFEPIPRDHWPIYQVNNWSTGVATAQDGRKAWNIQVLGQSLGKSQSGRKPIYDQDQINGEVRRLFRKLGPYGSDKEAGWQTRADLEGRIAQFLVDTTGQSPAKSTLQSLAKKALDAITVETT
jgi:hypothetical protein